MADDSLDAPNALEAAIVRHYARETEGSLPPLEPHPGYPSLAHAIIGRRRWLAEQFPPERPTAPTPQALPDSPPEE